MRLAHRAVPGLLDTNVFIHAYARDSLTEECRGFLIALERGLAEAHLDPLVLHELSYALPHYIKQMARDDVAEFLLMVLSWDGIHGDKDRMVDAVERWRTTPGLAFVDAYLAALAHEWRAPIYTKNIRELRGQDVEVPSMLSTG
jgi:predicted nucleic acid-binding protein